jgi:hypothetical protein
MTLDVLRVLDLSRFASGLASRKPRFFADKALFCLENRR